MTRGRALWLVALAAACSSSSTSSGTQPSTDKQSCEKSLATLASDIEGTDASVVPAVPGNINLLELGAGEPIESPGVVVILDKNGALKLVVDDRQGRPVASSFSSLRALSNILRKRAIDHLSNPESLYVAADESASAVPIIELARELQPLYRVKLLVADGTPTRPASALKKTWRQAVLAPVPEATSAFRANIEVVSQACAAVPDLGNVDSRWPSHRKALDAERAAVCCETVDHRDIEAAYAIHHRLHLPGLRSLDLSTPPSVTSMDELAAALVSRRPAQPNEIGLLAARLYAGAPVYWRRGNQCEALRPSPHGPSEGVMRVGTNRFLYKIARGQLQVRWKPGGSDRAPLGAECEFSGPIPKKSSAGIFLFPRGQRLFSSAEACKGSRSGAIRGCAAYAADLGRRAPQKINPEAAFKAVKAIYTLEDNKCRRWNIDSKTRRLERDSRDPLSSRHYGFGLRSDRIDLSGPEGATPGGSYSTGRYQVVKPKLVADGVLHAGGGELWFLTADACAIARAYEN